MSRSKSRPFLGRSSLWIALFLIKGRLNLGPMTAQEPTLTYTNSETQKPVTRAELASYTESYFCVNTIF
ncbi:hypothetical protein C4K04_5699 [Pseudomonas chlororaphis]|uniref:Uncharacterized protein n=1 Tax=Pseudomonas chlororaphis TaxID=587753 RepID=A0A3G7TW45_9PSED|nr:hypothetical protein C4K04_5699 [Pseudomonas chlororaphis]